jgi:two-component system CheB/CheR fusion protein
MRIRHSFLRYLIPFALVSIATILSKLALRFLGEISPLFFVAVMLSAWFGGPGPGLLSTLLAAWAGWYFFRNFPPGTNGFGWDDAFRLTIFLMIALLISFLLNMRRRAERELRLVNEGLELRVQQRTRDLEISNRKVRESEENLRALIEGVTDSAICMLDPTGHIVQWNSAAQKIQGYAESEILHKHFDLFYPARQRAEDRANQSLASAARAGRFEDEGWRLRKDGSPFWASVIITPLFDEQSSPRGFAHVARDITEVKRLEKEVIEISEKEQRRIGQDLHDGLGQELTGLAFLSQNITRRLADQSRPEASEMARISGMINLTIEQTRDLAKGLSPVDWGADGLVAALENLSSRIRELYGISCEFRRGRAVAIESHVAAVHLYRIAQEALSNAARHSNASTIWISIEGTDGNVVLTIEDNGSGIPTTNPSGKGMGLHLMPYRARIIGAGFEIKPRPGGGTIIKTSYHKLTDPADVQTSGEN